MRVSGKHTLLVCTCRTEDFYIHLRKTSGLAIIVDVSVPEPLSKKKGANIASAVCGVYGDLKAGMRRMIKRG